MTFWSAPRGLVLPPWRVAGPVLPRQVPANWHGGAHWILAGAFVLALHGIGFLLLRQPPQEMPAVTSPLVAMMVDLAPAAAPNPPALLHPPVTPERPALPPSPTVPQVDMPPSLPTMPRPQLLQRPAAVALPVAAKPQPQPTAKPRPQATPKPDRQPVQKPVTSPAPIAQPAPTFPPTAAVDTTSQQQLAAQAQRAAAAQAAKSSWLGDVVQHIAKFKRKPRSRLAAQTTVVVGFDIDRAGKLLSRRLVQSGGNAAIDAEALAWIDRADPLPLPPIEVSDGELARGFRLPLQFTLR